MAVDIFAYTTNAAQILNQPDSGDLVLGVRGNGTPVYIPINRLFGAGDVIISGTFTANGTSTFNGNSFFNGTTIYNGVTTFNEMLTANAGIESDSITATNFYTSPVAQKLHTSGITIEADGTDPDVPIALNAKGTSAIFFNSAGIGRFSIGVNGLQPAVTNTYDMGTALATMRNIYAARFIATKANGLVAAGTVTANASAGKLSCGTLTTASLTSFSFTFNNSFITDADTPIVCELYYEGVVGTDGEPIFMLSGQGVGVVTVTIFNSGLTAMNGAASVSYYIP